jgi:hypothetical protein
MLGTLSGVVARGMVCSRTGELAEAEAIFRSIFDAISETGMALWMASLFQYFIDTLLERPQLEDAIAMADAIELDRRDPAPFQEAAAPCLCPPM